MNCNTELSTVSEIIKAFQKIPQDLPVYVRSKYTGNVQYWEDHPIKAINVCVMESEKLGKHVTILY